MQFNRIFATGRIQIFEKQMCLKLPISPSFFPLPLPPKIHVHIPVPVAHHHRSTVKREAMMIFRNAQPAYRTETANIDISLPIFFLFLFKVLYLLFSPHSHTFSPTFHSYIYHHPYDMHSLLCKQHLARGDGEKNKPFISLRLALHSFILSF